MGLARRPGSVPRRSRGAAAARARRPAGRRRWRWRPDTAASGRGDGVVRSESCRRALRHAASHRCAQVPRRGVPPARPARLRGGVGGGDGRASIPPRGRRGVGLGRGVCRRADNGSGCVRTPCSGDRLRAHQAALCGRDRRDEAAGQDRDWLREARRGREPHPSVMAACDGDGACVCDLGNRHAHSGATRRARHPHRRRSRRIGPSRARPSLWPDHRSVSAGARDGRVRRAADRRAAPAARTKPRGHVRARPHRRNGDRRATCAGLRRRSRHRSPISDVESRTSLSRFARRPSSPEREAASSPSRRTTRPSWQTRRSRCSLGSRVAGRSDFSVYASNWRTREWQGALREPTEPVFTDVVRAIDERDPLSIDLLYTDQVGTRSARSAGSCSCLPATAPGS